MKQSSRVASYTSVSTEFSDTESDSSSGSGSGSGSMSSEYDSRGVSPVSGSSDDDFEDPFFEELDRQEEELDRQELESTQNAKLNKWMDGVKTIVPPNNQTVFARRAP